MTAPAPSRASMKFTLSLGVTAIPVACYKGTQDHDFERSEYTVDGRKVGRASVVVGSEPLEILVDRGQVRKCVPMGVGLVEVSDDEIAMLDFGVQKDTATVIGFRPLAELGATYMPEGAVWQVRPQANNVGASRSFALLLKAMRRKTTFALVEYCVRGKPRFGALLGNGRMYVLRYDEEMREELPLPTVEASEDEVRVIDLLVELMTPEEPPVLTDRFTQIVQDFVNAKLEAGAVIAVQDTPTPGPTGEAVQSLMDALTASIDQAKQRKASKPGKRATSS